MAGVKVTDLNALGSADANDVFYIVDTSANESKKIQVGAIFESGTWTPTFSSLFGAITSATLTLATYQKVGNVVTCCLMFNSDYDFSIDTGGEFVFTLPFATSVSDFGGSCSTANIIKQFNGSVKSNKIVITSSDTSSIANANFFAIFQYQIV